MNEKDIKTIHIHTDPAYDVLIGEGILRNMGILPKALKDADGCLIVTDDVVDSYYGELVETALQQKGLHTAKLVVPHGENSKGTQTLLKILAFAARSGLSRKSIMIALGGGVVGDLTGFAASVYMRGIKYVQIPTTLLAMVDSSVGGKTAVNLPEGKNLIGTFWQPSFVICDPSTLETLPESEFINGIAEVIKYGVIGDAKLLDILEAHSVHQNLIQVIGKCIQIKREIVERDALELGLRETLNYGHTIGHAIERISQYTIPHGIAVGIGMAYEARLAQALNICPISMCLRIHRIIETMGLPTVSTCSWHDLLQAAQHDKKNTNHQLAFVLPTAYGATETLRFDMKRLLEFDF